MLKKFKYYLLVGSMLFLSSCTQNYTYSYLIQHPAVLKKELDKCEANLNFSSEERAQCGIVMEAARHVSEFINELQENPEQFGQQILNAQLSLIKLKDNIQQAKQTGLDEKISAAKKAYRDKQDDINSMLAIVGMNSPG